jgi:hypothetical protein
LAYPEPLSESLAEVGKCSCEEEGTIWQITVSCQLGQLRKTLERRRFADEW